MTDDATRAVLARYQILVPEVKMRYEIKAMAARIAELERDATRLDWLAENMKRVGWASHGAGGSYMVHDPALGWVMKPTLRDAIDFGMIDEPSTGATHD